MATGSTSSSTPANSSSLAGDSPESVTTSPLVADSISPPATLGLSRPLASTLDSVRRRKSCCREMRPRSDVSSSCHSPLPGRVLVLVLARPHVGQGVVAVEREAPRRRHVEPGVRVAGRVLERHRDAADGVDERLERAEVDLDEVVGDDAEVLVDRVDQPLRLVAPVRRVDPRLVAGAGDRDVEVAGERQHGDAAGRRVDAEDHDRVAALADPAGLGVAERRGVRRVGVDARPVVGAGDEEVLRRRVGRRERAAASSCRRGGTLVARRSRRRHVGGRPPRGDVSGRRTLGRVGDLDDVAVAQHHVRRRRVRRR